MGKRRPTFIHPGSGSRERAPSKVDFEAAGDGTVAFDSVVFDAAVDLSWVDASRWFVYSYRGHRWRF